MARQEAPVSHEGDDLLSIAETAALLRVSPTTVWRLVRSGELPSFRIGKKTIRIRRADLGAIVHASRPMAFPESKRHDIMREIPGPILDVPMEVRLEATRRLLKLREEIGPIDSSVTDLIDEGREDS